MTLSSEKVKNLAFVFAGVLRAHLDDDDWKIMKLENAQDPTSNVCSSHDFCDANAAMEQALEVMGIDLTVDDIEIHTPLMNAAWSEARVRKII